MSIIETILKWFGYVKQSEQADASKGECQCQNGGGGCCGGHSHKTEADTFVQVEPEPEPEPVPEPTPIEAALAKDKDSYNFKSDLERAIDKQEDGISLDELESILHYHYDDPKNRLRNIETAWNVAKITAEDEDFDVFFYDLNHGILEALFSESFAAEYRIGILMNTGAFNDGWKEELLNELTGKSGEELDQFIDDYIDDDAENEALQVLLGHCAEVVSKGKQGGICETLLLAFTLKDAGTISDKLGDYDSCLLTAVVLALAETSQAAAIVKDWDCWEADDTTGLLLWAFAPEAAKRLYIAKPNLFDGTFEGVLFATGAVGEADLDLVKPENAKVENENFRILIVRYGLKKAAAWIKKWEWGESDVEDVRNLLDDLGYSEEEFDALMK